MFCGYGISRTKAITVLEKVLIVSRWVSDNIPTLEEIIRAVGRGGGGALEFIRSYKSREKVGGIR